jgi:hypothetical protein
MFVLQQIVITILAPAGVALLVLLAFARPFAAAPRSGLVAVGSALAPALGYTLSHGLVAGWPGLPPVDVTHWLLWFALLAGLVGVAEGLLTPPTAVTLGTRAVVSLGFVYLVLRPLIAWSFSSNLVSALWIVGLGAGLVGFWTLVGRLLASRGGLPPIAALLVLAAGSAAALGLAASTMLAQLAFVLAVTLGAAGLLAVVWPSFSLSPAAAPAISVLLFGLWLNGYFYAELPALSALLLAHAPVAVLGMLWLVRTRASDIGRFKLAMAHGGAVGLLVATALVFLLLQAGGAEENL